MEQQGVIKSYNPTKGFGFIDGSGGPDVFFLRSDNQDFADRGDTVVFVLTTGDRGPQAKDVRCLSRADGSCLGTVKSYNAQKGWGFIECEQTHQTYGKDVFFSRNGTGGVDISAGSKVTFVVTESEKGPQASNVKVLGGQPQGRAPAGPAPVQPAAAVAPALGALGGVPGVNQLLLNLVQALTTQVAGGAAGGKAQGKGMMAQPAQRVPATFGGKGGFAGGMQGMQKGGAAPSAAPGKDGQISFGTIKSFNEQKGWGFIQTNSGEDVFVLSRSLVGGPVSAGDLVVFSKSMGPKGWQGDSVSVVGAHELARSYVGTVKNFQAEKGWGFITAPEAQKFGDVFLHNRDLNGQTVNIGDTVEFTIEMGNNGRPQARNVQAGGGFGAAGGVARGGRAMPY